VVAGDFGDVEQQYVFRGHGLNALVFDRFQERLDRYGRELFAALQLDLFDCLFFGKPFAVRPVGGHGVVGVGQPRYGRSVVMASKVSETARIRAPSSIDPPRRPSG